MMMLEAVVAQVCKRLDSGDKLYQPPRGWDASDLDGCWTHVNSKSAPVDYCDGFRMFDTYGAALAYADTLPFSVMMLDPMVDRWTVEPLEAFYG